MRPTTATIDLGALSGNLAAVRAAAPGSKLMLAVKANAYGHGAVQIAPIIEAQVDAFAVAFLEEALALREAGICAPILLLEGHFVPEELPAIMAGRVWSSIHSTWQAEQWLAAPNHAPQQLWVKIDSGMHRLGLDPVIAPAHIEQLRAALPKTQLTLFTHLSSAEELDKPVTRDQLAQFLALAGQSGLPLSIGNSAGTLAYPQARQDWVRIGLYAYGADPFFGRDDAGHLPPPQPVMRLGSAVMAVRNIPAGDGVGYNMTWRAARPSRIATVPIGYGDGYPRHAPSGTPVWVGGHVVPLVGRVSMDLITLDITDLPEDIGVGTPVVLWGDAPSISAVARHAGTNEYALMTGLSARVPRHYDLSGRADFKAPTLLQPDRRAK